MCSVCNGFFALPKLFRLPGPFFGTGTDFNLKHYFCLEPHWTFDNLMIILMFQAKDSTENSL